MRSSPPLCRNCKPCVVPGICGYKVALTTLAMRKMVGYHDSVSGAVFQDQVLASGSTVRAGDYGHLLVEFEIAFRMAADLPVTPNPGRASRSCPMSSVPSRRWKSRTIATPTTRSSPARSLRWRQTTPGTRAWCWVQPVSTFTVDSLLTAVGVARMDGKEVGRGTGADVLGHPLDALAWLANHLQQRGLRLAAGHLATTGSLVASKFPLAGNTVAFEIDNLGSVSLQVV